MLNVDVTNVLDLLTVNVPLHAKVNVQLADGSIPLG